MDADELTEVYRALSSLLRDVGLGWIADQANEAISPGHVVARVPTRREPTTRAAGFAAEEFENRELGRLRPGDKRATITAVPYGPRDRALVLIRAVRRALTDSQAMTNRLALFIIDETARGTIRGVTAIVSVEDDGADRIVLTEVDRNESDSLQRAVELIDELARRVEE